MTQDPIDRQVEAWLDTGTDRAPERFVWEALNEIQRVPQRRPWLTWIDERLGPMSLPRSFVAAAVLLIAVVASFVVVGDPGTGGPAPTPGSYSISDLQRIVVWEDTKPTTWTLDSLITTPGDVLTIPARTLPADEFEDLEALQGYLGGRYADFSGPNAVFMSWGLVFQSAAQADRALPVFANEMAAADGWGLGPGEPIDLGEEAYVFDGDTRSLMGAPSGDPVPMRLYLWREGNILLAVGGWFDFDAAELEAVALAADRRAR